MLIFDVYTDGEVRQNNGTYSYSYGSPVTNFYNYFAWFVRSGGDLDSNSSVYDDSYG